MGAEDAAKRYAPSLGEAMRYFPDRGLAASRCLSDRSLASNRGRLRAPVHQVRGDPERMLHGKRGVVVTICTGLILALRRLCISDEL